MVGMVEEGGRGGGRSLRCDGERDGGGFGGGDGWRLWE